MPVTRLNSATRGRRVRATTPGRRVRATTPSRRIRSSLVATSQRKTRVAKPNNISSITLDNETNVTTPDLQTYDGKTVEEWKWELLGQLDEIRRQRFNWIEEVREHLTRDAKCAERKYQIWRRTADDIVAMVKGNDQGAAAWLIRNLFAHPRLDNPASFEVIIPTIYGTEAFMILGEKEERSHSNDQSKLRPVKQNDKDNAAQDQQDVLYLLSSMEPVNFDFECPSAPMTLVEATRRKLWICWTPSGCAFSLECPCPPLPAAVMSLIQSDATHDLIPRHFHEHPFVQDRALKHFQTVHGKEFEGQVGFTDMIRTYGRKVVADASESMPLDRWAVALNNQGALLWYNSLLSSWKALQEQYGPHSLNCRPLQTEQTCSHMTINAGQICGRAEPFPWPEDCLLNPKWVILCPHPNCLLPPIIGDPWRHNRAEQHLRAHGVVFRDHAELIRVCGYRILDNPSVYIAGTGNVAGSPGEHCNTVFLQPILQSVEADDDNPHPNMGDKSARVGNRRKRKGPGVINANGSEYASWSRKKLRSECMGRGLGWTNGDKPELIKLLLLDDAPARS